MLIAMMVVMLFTLIILIGMVTMFIMDYRQFKECQRKTFEDIVKELKKPPEETRIQRDLARVKTLVGKAHIIRRPTAEEIEERNKPQYLKDEEQAMERILDEITK